MRTKCEIRGYKYSNGCGGKKWVRGRTMFSEGRRWLGHSDYVEIIVKTDLDTHEMSVASLKEAKRFLTEDGYKKYVADGNVEIAMRGYR